MNTFNAFARRAAVASAAVSIAAVGFAGIAAAQPPAPPPPPADPDAVPAVLLDTNCTLDQLMAALKEVDPMVYGELVEKYNSEPGWLQGAIISHLNALLAKDPAGRQAEVDELAQRYPQFVPLFRSEEPNAKAIADKCPTYPAQDASVFAPLPPAP